MGSLRTIAALAVSVLLSGCMPLWMDPDFLHPGGKLEMVRETADWYGQNVRWGRLEQAAVMVRQEDRAEFIDRFVRLAGTFKFTSVEIMHIKIAEDGKTADVFVSYEFYQPPAITEEQAQEHQIWHFDKRRRIWQVQPDLTAFPLSDTAPVSSAPNRG